MNSQVFVFTAANTEACAHRERSIDGTVPLDEVGSFDRLAGEALARLG